MTALPDFDAEWDTFWRTVAVAASEAIRDVPDDHPDVEMFRQVTRDARAAAGLPALGEA